jgi:hypothetical protein
MTRLETTKSGSEGNWDGSTPVKSGYDVRFSVSKQPHASCSILSGTRPEHGLSMELGLNPACAMTAYQMHERRTDKNSIWSHRVQGFFIQ